MRSLLDLGDATLATEVLAAAPPDLAEQVATADVTTLVKPPRRITSANYLGELSPIRSSPLVADVDHSE